MIDISVIVVNYNTADLVKACIDSILRQQEVSVEIIVVDNNSRDASVKVLKEYGDKIKLLANHDNKGFGRANNQAFSLSRGRYIYLLNPDAELVTAHDLLNLCKFMHENAQYGLVGTRIVNKNNEPEVTAFTHYPRQKQSMMDFSRLPGDLATVLGASMFIRRDVYARLKGFDEDYFLYAEETDLCLRVRQLGLQIGYVENVTVRHIGSASERGNSGVDVMRKKKHGKYLFYCKHYPAQGVLAIARHDMRAARRKLLPLKILKYTLGLSKSQLVDYERHHVAYSIARQMLKSQ